MARSVPLNFEGPKLLPLVLPSLSCVAFDNDLKNVLRANYIGTKQFQDTIFTLLWELYILAWNPATLDEQISKTIQFRKLNAGIEFPDLQQSIAQIDSSPSQSQTWRLQVEATGEEIKGVLVATCLFRFWPETKTWRLTLFAITYSNELKTRVTNVPCRSQD
jgi:hypothetical protein